MLDRILKPAHPTPRPKEIAYFTGNPYYFQNILQIHQFMQSLPPKEITEGFNGWLSYEEMVQKSNMKLSLEEYKDFTSKLNFLWNYRNQNESISPFLSKFIKAQVRMDELVKPSMPLDDLGRSFTHGSRKTAKAQVWMIPGPGYIYVNGKHFSDYFMNQQELESIMEPFDVTEMHGKFNVWAIVNGSGQSSQADALRTGIARGLVKHHSDLLDFVSEMTRIDRRQVERKKTGQPKARKKITWFVFLYTLYL